MFFSERKYSTGGNRKGVASIFFAKVARSLGLAFNLIRLFPLRLVRTVEHVQAGILSFNVQSQKETGRRRIWSSIGRWWVDFLFFLLDLTGLANLYELMQEWLKPNTRSMRDWEKELARSVFGDSIQYQRVRIDEYALIGPRQYRICYVSANTVNTWGGMENSLLVHELAHVWQYQHLGLVYIPRALRAQRSKAGYNYGGVAQLQRYQTQGKTIFDFNLEQQADIVSDYYRLREGYPPRWGQAQYADLAAYEHFVQQLRDRL
jgi:hypothetical protein